MSIPPIVILDKVLWYNIPVTVSLILTVKNEADALPRLLDSIAAQTRAPDEIVVVDGGSTDATLDVLNARAPSLPLTIIASPGANISQGRNIAIRAARGDIICATDAGVRLEPEWAEELIKPLDEEQSAVSGQRSAVVDVVSGFFVPDPQSVFETALAATTLPVLADIIPEKFLPSSRSVAFRKRAWEQVNGYPEWLDFCEDLIFDFALRNAGFCFAFAPRAIAHFRPRASLRAFFKQYYQYARGDGKANLWFLRHVIRYTTYLIALPLCLALAGLGIRDLRIGVLGIGILIFGFFGMFFTSYKRLLPMLRDFSASEKLRALIWVPIIRVTGDVAKMIGYPVGIVWRMRNRK
ncbi:MAG: glycosyltransferase [Anaerolineales bacterium]|nr:glycosyltransferase [Anaerolineales bacterium]